MNKLLFFTLILLTTTAAAQDENIVPAKKGVVYGNFVTSTYVRGPIQTITLDELDKKITAKEYTGFFTGKVTEVCQAMGCWFTIQKSDGTEVMVKAKDHAFFLPPNLAGKTVAIDGTAKIKEITEAQRRHFAKDGGKSGEEIEQIKGSEKQMQIIAIGVKVLD